MYAALSDRHSVKTTAPRQPGSGASADLKKWTLVETSFSWKPGVSRVVQRGHNTDRCALLYYVLEALRDLRGVERLCGGTRSSETPAVFEGFRDAKNISLFCCSLRLRFKVHNLQKFAELSEFVDKASLSRYKRICDELMKRQCPVRKLRMVVPVGKV